MHDPDAARRQKAARAQLIIYIAMGVFIVLPFLLAWLSGAIRFNF